MEVEVVLVPMSNRNAIKDSHLRPPTLPRQDQHEAALDRNHVVNQLLVPTKAAIVKFLLTPRFHTSNMIVRRCISSTLNWDWKEPVAVIQRPTSFMTLVATIQVPTTIHR